MSLYPIPKGIINKIIQLSRTFLWSGNLEKKRLPLVSWDLMQLPKKLGGLSLGNALNKNLAMLFKWLWRYFDDPSQLWCQVIKAKFKYPASFTIHDLKIPVSGGPWKKICAAILNHPNAKKIAFQGIRKSVKSGTNCLFWLDIWAGSIPLKQAFPRLFSITSEPNASVSAFGFWEGLNWAWTFSWKRVLRPQDREEKQQLDILLQNVCLASDGNDKLIWSFNSSGKFSSKSFSLELDKQCVIPHHDAIRGLWKGLVPHRIEVFVWTALLERINTRFKLSQLRIIDESENLCVLCKKYPETSNHLLLHCEFACELWKWWIDLWSVKWVFPMKLRDAFEQWFISKKSAFFKKVWHASFFIIVWSIWKERNSRIFEKSENSPRFIKEMIMLRLGWWIKGWNEKFPYSPSDIQRNPTCLLWDGLASSSVNSKSMAAQIEWIPPPMGSLKWNVDASVSDALTSSAIGGVFRNHEGKFLCLFSAPIPFMEINCAEILAIHHAVKISIARGLSRQDLIIIESDSMNAVSWCNSDDGGPWNMAHHLNFIRNSRKRILNISIIHKGRESNFVADSLAKQGLIRNEEFVAWI